MKKEILKKQRNMKDKMHGVGRFFCSIGPQEKVIHHCGDTFVHQKGITLIALIVTIILMLILSTVVINLTIGENGLLKMAKTAE